MDRPWQAPGAKTQPVHHKWIEEGSQTSDSPDDMPISNMDCDDLMAMQSATEQDGTERRDLPPPANDHSILSFAAAVSLCKPYKAKYRHQSARVRHTVGYSYENVGASFIDILSSRARLRSTNRG